MKKTLSLLLACMFSLYALAQPCPVSVCPPSGGPYVDNGQIFTIDRYLARSMGVWDLAGLRAEFNAGTSHPGYCTFISNAVQLKAQFLRSVAGVWGQESSIAIGGPHWVAAADAANDINVKYDCAGLPRPMLGAGVYEHLTQEVDLLQIPSYVVNAFTTDPDYISQGFGSPGPHYFNFSSMIFPSTIVTPTSGFVYAVPDISTLRHRMWMYYQATQFISLGYNSIHLGALQQYNMNDIGNYKTADLLRKIRTYATNVAGTFVVFSADVDEELYEGSTNTLLLDFISSPMRPDETNYPGDMANTPCAGTGINTDLNIKRYIPNMYKRKGGVTLWGTVYDETPINFVYDAHANQDPLAPIAKHWGWQPWGWDESVWYYQLLLRGFPECQAYWTRNVTCALKNDLLYRSYAIIPGEGLNFWPHDKHYNFLTNSLLKNDILNVTWNPNTYLGFTITSKCLGCPVVPGYECIVTNPDCSSVYQWHVQDLTTGTWLPVTYGTKREITGLINGHTYAVGCVENNFGLNGSPVIALTKTIEVPTSVESCKPPMEGNAQHNAVLTDKSTAMPSISEYSNFPVASKDGFTNYIKALSEGNLKDGANIKVFPNPASDNISVELYLTQSEIVSIYMTDIMGNKVLEFCSKEERPKGGFILNKSLQNIVPGTYFVNCVTASGVVAEKIVVK